MINNLFKWLGCLFSFAFLVSSCAGTGTELTQKQVDNAYKGKPASNILVIAITGIEESRRSFEKKFVAQLKSVGVDAVSSHDAIPMPSNLKMKKEAILNACEQYKNDAVIITHLIGKEDKDVYTRGTTEPHGFYGYYGSRYTSSHHPGHLSTTTTVRLETNLYDVKTEKLMWSGQSKTWSKESKDRIMNDVIKAVINKLKKNNLIAPK